MKLSPGEAARRRAAVREGLLARSAGLRGPDLEGIAAADLRLLFDLYDAAFFAGHFGADLPGRVYFGLSGRLRSSAGMTRHYPAHGLFKITMGIDLFREAFRRGEAGVEVNGLLARDRLDAFLLVFEHELLHLAEWRLFGASSCGGRRFRALARNWFGHEGTTHLLPRAGSGLAGRVAAAGIRPGAAVRFEAGGRRFAGVVVRLTRRATVMVPDPRGAFRDGAGRRSAKYYVPLGLLEPIG